MKTSEQKSREIGESIDIVDKAVINLEKLSRKYNAQGTITWEVKN